MSPDSNVKEKLTVTMAPPPAALAAEKKKEGAKRTETENLLDGHAATLMSASASADEIAARFRKDGRKAGAFGFVFFGLASFWVLTHHGRWLHAIEGSAEKQVLNDAVHKLFELPWFFGMTTRLSQLYGFASLSALFLIFAVLAPGVFGRGWMSFAGVLGYVNTRIILAGAYYLIITPMAVFRKLVGKDSLRRAKVEGSYWIPRPKQRHYDHFERKF